MDIISASFNLLHGVVRPTPAARDPTGDHDWILSGLVSAFHGDKPSPVPTAEEAHDELDGRDPPPLSQEIPSVHAVVSHDDDARGGISETSSEHDVLGHVDGAPVIPAPGPSASADSLMPPSSRQDSAEDSDSESDDDLIILVNDEDQLPPSRPGEWCSPYQTWNSMRFGAKPEVPQEKRSEYRKIIDREEKLRKEMAVLKRNIVFFEKNCRPKQPIGKPIPVEYSSTERLPYAETTPPRRLHSDVIIQIELQDIDLTTFVINGAPEKADKDLKREGGEGDEEDGGINASGATKLEKKRKRDHKVDDATGVHRVFCRRRRVAVERR